MHQLQLSSGERIHYKLDRRQRRTIGLKITADGLVIHAPMRVTQSQIESAIVQKSSWIHQKLLALQNNKITNITWKNGEILRLFGNDITLLVQTSTQSKVLTFDKNTLLVALPNVLDTENIAKKVLHWYKKQAFTDFARRLEILSAKLGVPCPKMFLSNAKTRWGSCNSRREIRLNWRLLQAPPHIINYVICHELAHLKEMNHSAKFWAVVARIFPDYKQAEKDLKIWSPKLHAL